MKPPRPKSLTPSEALTKIQRYCAYQDRCHQEVRFKLLEWGVRGHDLEVIMVELIAEKFLNEERFARSFVRGKYRIKKWGRNKIQRELKRRDITGYCLKAGLSEIEEEVYLNNLQTLLEKKALVLREKNPYKRKNKLAQFALQKGYESHLIWEVLASLEAE